MGAVVSGPPSYPPPPFHNAVKLGFVHRAEAILEKKADVNVVDCRGFTALMHVVQAASPNMDMISHLLRWKADPSITDPVYNTNALHIACHFCNEHAARLFIHNGAPVNATTKQETADGVTPLFICAQKGYASMVTMLLSAKADANIARASDDTSPIHIASQKGYTKIVRALIPKNVTSMKTLNAYSRKTCATALYAACVKSHPMVVQYLASAKADINKVETKGRLTPLFIAKTLGHTHIVRILENCKANTPDYLPSKVPSARVQKNDDE